MRWLMNVILLAWPLAEITLFVVVANAIGWLNAFLLVAASTMGGILLFGSGGRAMSANIRAALARGEMPEGALFDGTCVALAALLLLIPGFLTDLLAVPLLLPPFRKRAAGWFSHAILDLRGPGGQRDPGVIEGEWHVVNEDDHPVDPGSPSSGCVKGSSVIATDRSDPRSES